MNIADRIKKIREVFEVTSNEFAKITGIHPVSIRKYETNKMVPGNDVIEKMSEALKLPKMIFEGLPKQYTNYDYIGDFYQQLLLLLDNGTLSLNETTKIINNKPFSRYSLNINPKLSNYVILKHDGKEIPLTDLSIEFRQNTRRTNGGFVEFSMYLNYLKEYKDALSKNHLNTKDHESNDDHSNKLLDLALEYQMELMLMDHSWQDYMSGPKTKEDIDELFDKAIKNGGNFYDFVEQLDVPVKTKAYYITEHENLWIEDHYIDKGPRPENGTTEELDAYELSIIQKVEDYKDAHPNYQKEIKEDTINETKREYEEYLAEQKESGSQN
jgi:transcriptional regulator with XRE-family HTH domain